MNDEGYLDSLYEGSQAQRSTLYARDRESLLNRRYYSKIAVEYHRKENNPKQVEFFEADLALIDKRLKELK